eukprot:Unigene6649_Nuclearia_a/m.20419 Unigene6649_Nuclearia_a/g.20419  ORF Unigene6649_Nuclearia_a/g.20419 Unigene6649_Nuclearia_a/m.20419 type:complete len:310 (-) Unigene6649_Nuclearia_a:2743-3672(-)
MRLLTRSTCSIVAPAVHDRVTRVSAAQATPRRSHSARHHASASRPRRAAWLSSSSIASGTLSSAPTPSPSSSPVCSLVAMTHSSCTISASTAVSTCAATSGAVRRCSSAKRVSSTAAAPGPDASSPPSLSGSAQSRNTACASSANSPISCCALPSAERVAAASALDSSARAKTASSTCTSSISLRSHACVAASTMCGRIGCSWPTTASAATASRAELPAIVSTSRWNVAACRRSSSSSGTNASLLSRSGWIAHANAARRCGACSAMSRCAAPTNSSASRTSGAGVGAGVAPAAPPAAAAGAAGAGRSAP